MDSHGEGDFLFEAMAHCGMCGWRTKTWKQRSQPFWLALAGSVATSFSLFHFRGPLLPKSSSFCFFLFGYSPFGLKSFNPPQLISASLAGPRKPYHFNNKILFPPSEKTGFSSALAQNAQVIPDEFLRVLDVNVLPPPAFQSFGNEKIRKDSRIVKHWACRLSHYLGKIQILWTHFRLPLIFNKI